MNRKESDDSLDRYLLHAIQAELERKWKRAEDRKNITKDACLVTELDKLPAHWTQAIAHQLGYLDPMNKEECVRHIAHALANPVFVMKTLLGLSRSSLYILKYVLSKGGWSTFQVLSRQANTDQSEDSWWWMDEPPTSPLGQLRARGLLFVGRTLIKKRVYKVAVVPRELRNLFGDILPQVYAAKNSRRQRSNRGDFSSADTKTYLELLENVERCFRMHLPEPFPVTNKQVIRFLERLRLNGRPMDEIDQAWEDIQCLFALIAQNSLQKHDVADLKSWDFSYLVSIFIPKYFNEPKLTHEEVKRILENLAVFYQTLANNGDIPTDREIRVALAHIVQEDGKINRILRPHSRGPENALKMAAPTTEKPVLFTNNDIWIITILCLEYNEDWRAMIGDLEQRGCPDRPIVDAARKRRHLLWLRRKLREHNVTPYKVLWHLKPTTAFITEAKRWFDRKKLIEQ